MSPVEHMQAMLVSSSSAILLRGTGTVENRGDRHKPHEYLATDENTGH